MSISGEIKSLYLDREENTALFPRTKTKAVSDDRGVNLDVLLEDKASKAFVTSKIAEAQLGGGDGSDIDLSGYATKDDLNAKQDAITGLTNSMVMVCNSSGKITTSSSISTTELANLDGVTSNIQTQLDARYKVRTTINNKEDSDIKDLNEVKNIGYYWVQCAGVANTPFGDNTSGKYGHLEYCGNGLQRFTQYGSDGIVAVYERDNVQTGWKAWRRTDGGGYGLGKENPEKTISTVADLDSAKAAGWYRYACPNTTLNNITFNYGVLFVSPIQGSDDGCHQELIIMGTGIILRRDLYNGTWYNWQAENPPMVFGTEYLTTERFNGKVVYSKLVNFGTMPNKANKYTSVGTLPVGAKNVQFYGFAYEASSGEHFALNYPGVKCWVNTKPEAMYIGMNTDADWTTCTAYFIVKYTKD